MDGRQDCDGGTGQGRRRARGVLAAYLITGTTLAISRVWLYVWMVHRYASHTVTETVVHLQRCFYPEALLADYTRLSVTHVSRMQPS